MFAYPATELFRGEDRRVVWSLEEFDAAVADGWSEERTAATGLADPGVNGIVKRTAPTLEQVLAAGYSPEAAANIVANEQRKFAAGVKPYGPNEDVPPPPESPATGPATADKQPDPKKPGKK